MKQSEWTQQALAALEQAGLIQTGFVNIRGRATGAYELQVADADSVIHELTVLTIKANRAD